jgi:hypothetical protein
VTLGLHNNQSQLLSVFPLLYPLLYLHYFQVCYNVIKPDFRTSFVIICSTLILLTWRIWWAPNNARKWLMGYTHNSAFKGLILFSSFRGWLLGFGTNYFYGVGLSAPRPGGPGCPFSSGSSPFTCLAWKALPVAHATASIALGFIWPGKPLHYVKVSIPLGGGRGGGSFAIIFL